MTLRYSGVVASWVFLTISALAVICLVGNIEVSADDIHYDLHPPWATSKPP